MGHGAYCKLGCLGVFIFFFLLINLGVFLSVKLFDFKEKIITEIGCLNFELSFGFIG